ncbi:hypothetical protein PSP6_200107 [Paraburkholderia tropica]|nr:hypothetical protein PSP6_200107 [Paraburkholderia tropica]
MHGGMGRGRTQRFSIKSRWRTEKRQGPVRIRRGLGIDTMMLGDLRAYRPHDPPEAVVVVVVSGRAMKFMWTMMQHARGARQRKIQRARIVTFNAAACESHHRDESFRR